jgi:hypothetical protein
MGIEFPCAVSRVMVPVGNETRCFRYRSVENGLLLRARGGLARQPAMSFANCFAMASRHAAICGVDGVQAGTRFVKLNDGRTV